MFRRKTVIVLGAGASAEVDLPIGTGLARIIREKLDIRFGEGHSPIGGDHDLYAQFRKQYPNDRSEYQKAGWLIRDGILLANSVDDVLDNHKDNERVNRIGKTAVVKSILEAEAKSKLYIDQFSSGRKLDFDILADTWYVKFMRMLGRGISKENVREIFSPVSFIVFNYDRCLEQFLLYALQALYNIAEDDALNILSDLQIIRPYGTVGSFAASPYSNGIRYGAGTNASLEFVFGTAFKMSDADTAVVASEIAKFFEPTAPEPVRLSRIKIENKLTCSALFDNYGKSLSGGD